MAVAGGFASLQVLVCIGALGLAGSGSVRAVLLRIDRMVLGLMGRDASITLVAMRVGSGGLAVGRGVGVPG